MNSPYTSHRTESDMFWFKPSASIRTEHESLRICWCEIRTLKKGHVESSSIMTIFDATMIVESVRETSLIVSWDLDEHYNPWVWNLRPTLAASLLCDQNDEVYMTRCEKDLTYLKITITSRIKQVYRSKHQSFVQCFCQNICDFQTFDHIPRRFHNISHTQKITKMNRHPF